MRIRTVSLVFLLTVPMLSSARQELSLEDLVQRAESARPDDRPGLYMEIMQRQLKAADRLYPEGKVQDAQAAILDIASYSDKAHDAALQAPRRLKSTEIAMRKIAVKLRDLKRTLNFEDQAPVDAAADHLERVRTDLLSHMFGKN